MNKKVIISIVIIICTIIIAIIACNYILICIQYPEDKYVLGSEVIVADNTEEDEDKYNEYINDYDISGKIESVIDDEGVTIYNAEETRIILNNLPLPRKIIYYHKGVPYVFKYGTEEYDNIIKLNNSRDTGNVKLYTYLTPLVSSYLKLNIDMLEYYYDENKSSSFNLDSYMLSGEKYKSYWISPEVVGGSFYVGLENPEELVKYLRSVISK